VIGSLAKIAVGMLALGAIACVELSAPKNQPASISLIQLPELFIVRGDAMRDSLGKIVPPTVVAFDGNGTPISDFTATFFVTDTVPLFGIASNGSLVAGTRTGIGHLLGQIGGVQTPSQQIYVTVEPKALVNTTTGSDTLLLVLNTDSAKAIATFSLSVAVRGGTGAPTDSGVGGAFVNYRLVSPPLPSTTSAKVAYIGDASNNPSVVDTTAGSGVSQNRRLIVNSSTLADTALLNGSKVATLVVEASMSYRGVPLLGSPQRFAITLKSPFAK
jgi:hypothetical protein